MVKESKAKKFQGQGVEDEMRGSVVVFLASAGVLGGLAVVPARVTFEKSEDPVSRQGPARPPTVTALFSLRHPASVVGHGTMQLGADPQMHEFRVSLLLGTAVTEPRWATCNDLGVAIDNRWLGLSSSYTMVNMYPGVYEALRAEASIVEVRLMAVAAYVSLEACGDRLVLGGEELQKLREFVRQFDAMASRRVPRQSPPTDERSCGVLWSMTAQQAGGLGGAWLPM